MYKHIYIFFFSITYMQLPLILIWQWCLLCSITAFRQSIQTDLFWRFCVLNILRLFFLPPVFSAKWSDLCNILCASMGAYLSPWPFLCYRSPPGIDQGVLSLTAALPVPLSRLSAVAIQAAQSSLFFWLQVEVNASNKEPRKLRFNQIKPV